MTWRSPNRVSCRLAHVGGATRAHSFSATVRALVCAHPACRSASDKQRETCFFDLERTCLGACSARNRHRSICGSSMCVCIICAGRRLAKHCGSSMCANWVRVHARVSPSCATTSGLCLFRCVSRAGGMAGTVRILRHDCRTDVTAPPATWLFPPRNLPYGIDAGAVLRPPGAFPSPGGPRSCSGGGLCALISKLCVPLLCCSMLVWQTHPLPVGWMRLSRRTSVWQSGPAKRSGPGS